jgi:hypothetical protein
MQALDGNRGLLPKGWLSWNWTQGAQQLPRCQAMTCAGQPCVDQDNVSQQGGDLILEPVCENPIDFQGIPPTWLQNWLQQIGPDD